MGWVDKESRTRVESRRGALKRVFIIFNAEFVIHNYVESDNCCELSATMVRHAV